MRRPSIPGALNVDLDNLTGDELIGIGIVSPQEAQTTLGSIASYASFVFKNILDFNPLANTGDVDAGTEAWAALLAYCNERGMIGWLPAGTYTIATAPGTIPNPLTHNCPQVDYDYINIMGAGRELVTIVCVPGPSATQPTIVTSNPILKAVASDSENSYFGMSGVTLDGGISVAPPSLATGPDPDSCALLEVRGYARVEIDVGLTKFAQNYDTNTPDNGNFGRRGPMLIWGNTEVDVAYRLMAPTFREGPFLGNNIYTTLSPVYRGPANDLLLDAVSSPVNCFSRSADPAIGGEYLLINRPDITGCWRGSAGNFYIPGDIIFLGGPTLRGSITTVNTTTGNAFTTGDAYNWGKGWDFGGEIAAGPTRSLYIQDGHVAETMTYSWKINRIIGTNIGSLVGNASARDCMNGLDMNYVDHLDFFFEAKNILWYAPYSPSGGGIAVRALNCNRGSLKVDIDGSGTAIYNYPNATVPSTGDVPRISRLGVWKTHSQGVAVSGTIKDCAGQLIYEDVDALDQSGIFDAIWSDLAFYTDVYPVSDTVNKLIRVGSGASLLIRSLWQNNCSYNGLPLIMSEQLQMHVAQPVDGLQRSIWGNWNAVLPQGTLLADLSVHNGDGSTGNAGIHARITSYTVDPIGRGADLWFETSAAAGPPIPRVGIQGGGAFNFVPLASVSVPVEGDSYYDSALKNWGVWNGTGWSWVGVLSYVVGGSVSRTPPSDADGYAATPVTGSGAAFAAPSGTPVDFKQLVIRVKDDGVSRSLTWDPIYRASASVPLPSVTVPNETMYLTFCYNALDVKWDLIAFIDGL